jgi:transcription-repair coupling factor (superfamily II helicase)
MDEKELEKVMLDFIEGSYDVLVCTTIVENGLDIANVNTLIVDESDSFGLAQLYQLRGRVGRSNRLAYAYFTYRQDKVLGEIAEKRLAAIREFTAFGSGYKIALRDLQIRGRGTSWGRSSMATCWLSALTFTVSCWRKPSRS